LVTFFFIKTESNRKWSPLSWRTRHSFPGGKRKEKKKMMLVRHQRFSDSTSHIGRERRLRLIKWHSEIKILTIKTSCAHRFKVEERLICSLHASVPFCFFKKKIQLYPQDSNTITKKSIMQLQISSLTQAFYILNLRVIE
jgi:hypothetical protein